MTKRIFQWMLVGCVTGCVFCLNERRNGVVKLCQLYHGPMG